MGLIYIVKIRKRNFEDEITLKNSYFILLVFETSLFLKAICL